MKVKISSCWSCHTHKREARQYLDESMEGGAHTLQEQVVPGQELAIPLQQVQGCWHEPPQDVHQAEAQLQHTSIILGLRTPQFLLLLQGRLLAPEFTGGWSLMLPAIR